MTKSWQSCHGISRWNHILCSVCCSVILSYSHYLESLHKSSKNKSQQYEKYMQLSAECGAKSSLLPSGGQAFVDWGKYGGLTTQPPFMFGIVTCISCLKHG